MKNNILNPLGVIIENVSSSIFCAMIMEQKMYREPFLMKFSLFSIRFFSKITRTEKKLSSKTNYTQRVILKLLFLFLITSCSSNDDSIDPIAEDPKILPKRFQVLSPNQSGELVTAIECSFHYNANKQIHKMDISSLGGNQSITFTYGTHGLPTKMDVATIQGIKQFNFGYDGILLSSFSVDGNQYPVIHNATNNSYSFQKNGDPTTYFLNNSNDVNQSMGMNPNGTPNLFIMEYENEKNGFLHNIHFPLHLYIGIASDVELFMMMAHRPLLKISTYSNFEYTNAFNDEDFIMESIMNVDQYQNTIRYEYQEL